MSKMYQLNRMSYSPAAGGILGDVLKIGGKLVKGIFKKKTVQQVATVAAKVAKNPVAQGAAGAAGWMVAESALSGKGGGGAGASGGWGARRRARGITALELRGYRKVANLIHREGMVSRRARGRK